MKDILLNIIRNKACLYHQNCSAYSMCGDGTVDITDCPLLDKYCTVHWVDYNNDPGDEYDDQVNRNPDFVQLAIKLFIEEYGEDMLFGELL